MTVAATNVPIIEVDRPYDTQCTCKTPRLAKFLNEDEKYQLVCATCHSLRDVDNKLFGVDP